VLLWDFNPDTFYQSNETNTKSPEEIELEKKKINSNKEEQPKKQSDLEEPKERSVKNQT